MALRWTFGRRLGAGFAVMTVLSVFIGAAATYGLANVVDRTDRVITDSVRQLVTAERLRAAASATAVAVRGYLLTGREDSREDARRADTAFESLLASLPDELGTSADHVALVNAVRQAAADYSEASDRVVELRRAGAPVDEAARAFQTEVDPRRQALDDQISALRDKLADGLAADRRAASSHANRWVVVILTAVAFAALLATGLALLLTRHLTREVGGAVGQVQSSSAELEAVAAQQANGAREQATAMSEITTTTNELMINSRQVVDIAQRVYSTAEETAGAARSGEATIDQTRGSIEGIRRQVELIVQHMLELGDKSQQIGGIVDLVSELAEQTNILAINATIEATGAGEAGRRFAVVADEIRKLADRTGASAKEIRGLVEDVRGAVNTTVMATETGAKAVDAGTERFNQVTQAFGRISDMVATTTDAAREIELSTKQQTSAIEQANSAVADSSRVARETEASATQTRQTAAQLAGLSANLLRLVTAKAGRAP